MHKNRTTVIPIIIITPPRVEPQSKQADVTENFAIETQPSFDQFKSASKLNPQTSTTIIYEPSNVSKLLMLPFPFLMVGCFSSKTTVLHFNLEQKSLLISSYPGFLRCCRKEYKINYDDIVSSKMIVAYNHRINKRQAFRLYLETRMGDFQLTVPKNREEILIDKNYLDDVLRYQGIGKDN